jgi:uncharacterized membrane protein
MSTGRLETLSDGVLAIVITIMVLELKVPAGHDLSDLAHTTGFGLLTYLVSFVYVGIYWNNHHHMFHLVRRVSGGVLWANLALLFCLSLLPFTTAWLDESRFARSPVVVYGLNLLAAAVAYVVLQNVIIRGQGSESPLRRAVSSCGRSRATELWNACNTRSTSRFWPFGSSSRRRPSAVSSSVERRGSAPGAVSPGVPAWAFAGESLDSAGALSAGA